MKVLAIGDVCGGSGCRYLLKMLPVLKKKFGAEFVIVNGENSDEANGISNLSADMIFAAGADVITGGNHTLRNKNFYETLDSSPFLLRPDNIKADFGKGYCLVDKGKFSVAVINLCGITYMERSSAENFMTAADSLVKRAEEDGAKFIFVDFHAEATSEKKALALYLDGKVSAVFGTHTHVLTADAQILKNGTGFITDIGMTGSDNSVIGVKSDIIINRLKNNDMSKFEFSSGENIICGCLFETDNSGRCRNIMSFKYKEGSDEKI